MKSMRIFFLTILTALVPIVSTAQIDPTPFYSENPNQSVVSFSLIPGDSYVALGIHVEWVKDGSPALDIVENSLVHLTGPKTQLRNIDLTKEIRQLDLQQMGIQSPYGARNVSYINMIALLDDVRLNLRINNTEEKNSPRFMLGGTAEPQPSIIPFTGKSGDKSVFVSSYNPVTLDDQLDIQLLENKSLTGNVTSKFEIQVTEKQTGQTHRMPVSRGVTKTYLRFSISVNLFTETTQTAELAVHAKEDYSIRGKDTLVKENILILENETVEEALNRLGKQFDFQVEWAPEGNAETINYVKQYKFMGGSRNPLVASGSTVEKSLEIFFNPLQSKLRWEWIDAHHLRIDTSPAIATIENERKQREEEIEKERKQKEEEQAILEQGEKRFNAHKSTLEQFQQIFQLETRVYSLQTITPITAKLLIAPSLNYFFITPREIFEPYSSLVNKIHGGDFYYIASASEKMLKGIHDYANNLKTSDGESGTYILRNSENLVREEAIADEKSNVLIVNAVPKTHEKIAEVLKQVDQQTGIEKSKSIQQYKIEIVLISGSTQNDATEAAVQSTENTELLKKYGIEEIDVRLLDIQSLQELSKSIIPLTGEKGEIGTAKVSLSDDYSCELSFLDLREPYLVVRGTLNHRVVDFLAAPPTDATNLPEAKREEKEKVLLQNTLFLEKDKPTLLGVTNLNEALIMILRYVE